MRRVVHKQRIIDGHRIGETESWLTDMAARGLHLEKMGPMFARFERGEARQMRYRIDFAYRKDDTEQRALYAESGWEFVCAQHEMSVYRSPEAADAPELHTDPAEQAFTLQRLKRRLTIFGFLAVFLYAVSFCMMGLTLFIGKTPMLTLIEGGMANMPFLALTVFSGVFFIMDSIFSIRKLVSTLQEGRAINHRADWKRVYRSRVAATLFLLALTPFTVGLPFVSLATWHTEELPLVNDHSIAIRLSDIENDPALLRRESFQSKGVDWGNSFTSRWSPYAPVMLEIREQGVVPGRLAPDGVHDYWPMIDCDIYKLRFAWMADGLIADLRHRYEDGSIIGPLREELGRQGFDRLLIRDQGYGCLVIAARGHIVFRLWYSGEMDLQAVLDAGAEIFDRIDIKP